MQYYNEYNDNIIKIYDRDKKDEDDENKIEMQEYSYFGSIKNEYLNKIIFVSKILMGPWNDTKRVCISVLINQHSHIISYFDDK